MPCVRSIRSRSEILESRSRSEQRLQQLLRARRRQRVEPHLLVVRLAPPAVPVLRPVVCQQEQPRRRNALDQQVQPRLRLRIDPVQVLDHEQHRLDLALPQHEALQRLQRLPPSLWGIEPRPLGILDRHVEQREERRQRGLQRAVQRQELARHLLAHLSAVVAGLDPEVAAQELDHREVRGGLAVGHRRGLEHQPPLLRCEWVNSQARRDLPTPGSPTTATTWPWPSPARPSACRKSSSSASRPTKRVSPREAAACSRLRTGLAPPSSNTSIGATSPFTGTGPARGHLHEPLGKRQRLRSQQDRSGLGHLLHPRGQVRGLPDRRVVHAEIAADGAHHHLARVEAHPDLDRHPVAAKHPLGVALHRLLHPQRRIARAHRVVLVRQRSAEEGHDPVAHHLVDGALVPMHRLHHVLEHGIEQLARLFRIALGQQLHRALEVGEEHRDLLPLALQSALGREDLLGQVLGRVGGGGAESGRRRLGPRCRRRASDRGPERLTAASAELPARRDRDAAGRAELLQLPATLLAEADALTVLEAAARTTHQRSVSGYRRSLMPDSFSNR